MKKIFWLFLCMYLAVGLTGCESDSSLPKAGKGNLAQSEHYHVYGGDTEAMYYRPVEFNQVFPYLPEKLKQNAKLIDPGKLPFPVGKQNAYLVSFQSGQESGHLHQVQFSYLKDKDEYGRYGNEFAIVRMTETASDPFVGFVGRKSGTDDMGNRIEVETIGDDNIRLYHHILQTGGGYVYSYYDWDEQKRSVQMVKTMANEIDFYHNGVMYQIGYLVNGNQFDENVQKQMVALAKELVADEEG
ncbi:hypothetical protein [Brevibacillus borstelensis]|uniref:hypothetical protein n=1 Tax=Brevibacillus borstelensis TaxID=45462 RepID=UPI00068A21D4|nr:hypothetical protein [Brevibacillus borstelensis]